MKKPTLFKKIIVLATLSTFSFSSLYAAHYKVSGGSVEFKAKGFPTFITISGKSQKVMGELMLDKMMASGEFKLPLASLKTGIDLRDEHMTEKYLEVAKYPNATLKLKPFKLESEGQTTGLLTLHNVTKEVPIQYTTSKGDDSLKVMTNFKIVLNDYQIAIPSFQGITVAKDIDLKVEFMAREK